jgi:hypothetical protein
MGGLLWREEGPLYCRGVRFLVVAVAALTLLTAIPYVAGYRLDDDSSEFLDTLVFEQDFNSYAAFVRQSAAGAWLFHNPFTPEPHRPIFLNVEFLVTGKAAALLGLEAGLALQVQRAIAGAVFALGLWALCARAIATPAARRVALLAVLTGGGLGWMKVLPLVGPHVARLRPVDLYAGVHPFFWLLLHPHFLIAETLVVFALWAMLEGERTGRPAWPGGAGLLAAIAGLVRPYDMLFVQAVAVLFAAVTAMHQRKLEGPAAARRLLPALVPLPVLAYCVWLFRFDPVFQWWGRQGVNGPPPAPAVLTGLGLLTPLLVVALVAGRRRAWTPGEILMACAAAASLLLTYSYPWLRFSFQFVTTLVVPGLLLAVARLRDGAVGSARRGRPLVALLLAVNALTSVTLWATHLGEARAGAHRIARSDLGVFSWLGAHSHPREVVLAGPRTANRIPRYNYDAVVAGYEFSTVRYVEKLEEVRRFYDVSTEEAYRQPLLAELRVRYVIHGPEERRLGAYNPARSEFLAAVFREGPTTVYEVKP